MAGLSGSQGQSQGYQTQTPIKGSFNVYMCIKVWNGWFSWCWGKC